VESNDAARASTCYQVEPVSEGFPWDFVLALISRSILWLINLSEPVCIASMFNGSDRHQTPRASLGLTRVVYLDRCELYLRL
jgi:hypothetical protein